MKVSIVCGANASRSQAIEEFLRKECDGIPDLQIKSYGTNVVKLDELGEKDRRVQFTAQAAQESDIIFVADHYNFYRVKKLAGENSDKVYLLRIPDVFHIHRNAYPRGEGLLQKITAYLDYEGDMMDYVQRMGKKERESFESLNGYVRGMSPREASIFLEAVYTKELNKPNPEARQNYPFELLTETLHFRSSWMLNIILQKYIK